jgi:ubiquinone/menaquinone biosynthesis C-methylase UbiE
VGATSDAERLERERIFHDEAAVEGRGQDKFYRALTAAHAHHLKLLERAARDGLVLEIGCGGGDLSSRLARTAKRVVGVDLSEGRIRRAREKHLGAAPDGVLTYEPMNAEQLDFPADTFDLVCGGAILHHLDLERALGEVARVLKPEGRAIFLEPLGHNPLINAYRRFSPEVRTIDEHPLLVADLEKTQRFETVRSTYFHLLALAALPFTLVHEPTARALAKPLEALDRLLFKVFPPARKLGWMVVVELSGPRS